MTLYAVQEVSFEMRKHSNLLDSTALEHSCCFITDCARENGRVPR